MKREKKSISLLAAAPDEVTNVRTGVERDIDLWCPVAEVVVG